MTGADPVVGSVEPTGPEKIAIIGTSPTSWTDAPFEDPSWQIWGLSRLFQDSRLTRWDVWFELHRMEDLCKSWSAEGDEAQEAAQRRVYLEWMAEQERPIYMREQFEQIPASIRYPREKICEAFPRRYFTNTVSYMIALAIVYQPKVIGLWGIDMAQKPEYQAQRPSCEYFLGIAEGQGIEVYLPPQCNLLKTARLYALEDPGPIEAAVKAKHREMARKRDHYHQVRAKAEKGIHELNGALDMLQFLEHNYDFGGVER